MHSERQTKTFFLIKLKGFYTETSLFKLTHPYDTYLFNVHDNIKPLLAAKILEDIDQLMSVGGECKHPEECLDDKFIQKPFQEFLYLSVGKDPSYPKLIDWFNSYDQLFPNQNIQGLIKRAWLSFSRKSFSIVRACMPKFINDMHTLKALNLLGISLNDLKSKESHSIIKNKFRKKALRIHPDKNRHSMNGDGHKFDEMIKARNHLLSL